MVSRFGLCQIVRKIAKIVRADDCPSGKTVRTIGGRSSRYLGRFLNGGQSCLGQRVIASALGDVLVLDEPDYDAVGKLLVRLCWFTGPRLQHPSAMLCPIRKRAVRNRDHRREQSVFLPDGFLLVLGGLFVGDDFGHDGWQQAALRIGELARVDGDKSEGDLLEIRATKLAGPMQI